MYMEPLNKQVSIQELMYMREKQHMSNMQIARQLNVSYGTILRYLGKQGETSKTVGSNCGNKITEDMIARIQEMRQQGRSINGIAEKLGISWKTAQRYARVRMPQAEDAGNGLESDDAPDGEREDSAMQAYDDQEEPMRENAGTAELTVLHRQQHIRLKGSECEYEVETGGGSDSITVISGKTEVLIFDRGSLLRFINELQTIDRLYFEAHG